MPELPMALLAEVLQHVPLNQRLSGCACVCKAWASAATLATVHLELQLSAATVPAFEAWAQQHGGQLTSLQLAHSSGNECPLQLPLGQLTKLQLLEVSGLRLQLPCMAGSASRWHPSTSTPSSISPQLLLPSLQKLQLSGDQGFRPQGLLQFTQGGQLTSLSIIEYDFSSNHGRDDAQQQLHAALSTMLQQLPQLVFLHLPRLDIGPAVAQHLSAMTGLQDLNITLRPGMNSSSLQHLPSSMTRLEIQDARGYYRSDHTPQPYSLPAQLSQLTALRQLQVAGGALLPGVLGAFTQLEQLVLLKCSLLPDVGRYPEPDGATALLQVLLGLRQLQHLRLFPTGAGFWEVPVRHCTALTAASQLTYLGITAYDVPNLPQGGVRYMFPSAWHLPQLQHLSLVGSDYDAELYYAPPWGLDSRDLDSIFQCCPGLTCLSLQGVVLADPDAVSELLQLPQGCRTLHVAGAAFDDDAAFLIEELSQLQDLSWSDNSGFSDLSLQRLTALTGLTKLTVENCKLSKELTEQFEGEVVCLYSADTCDKACDKVRGCHNLEDPVWRQLEKLLDQSPVCAPGRLQRLREAHSQLQQRSDEKEQDNARLQAQLAECQEQVRQLQEQLAVVQSSMQQ